MGINNNELVKLTDVKYGNAGGASNDEFKSGNL